MDNDQDKFEVVEELSKIMDELSYNYGGNFSMEFIQNKSIFYIKFQLYVCEPILIIAVNELLTTPSVVECIRVEVHKWINKQYSDILEDIK